MQYSPTDSELWQAVIEGQTSAFEQVVVRYQGLVSAIAYSRLGNFEGSQDVAQETFWVAWSNRDQLREPERLAAWLCGIARNLSHQHARSAVTAADQTGLDQVESPATASSQREQDEQAEVVWRAVEQLPEMYRETMLLFYRQEQSIAQVAGALDISPDAVKQRLSRARAMLREDLTSLVEETLVRTRPGKQFTTRVMAALVAMGTASAASTAQAAGIASAPLAVGAVKTIAATLAPGALGAAAGTASGLAGAYLGGYIPAELAPTKNQRDYMRSRARKLFLISLAFVAALIVAINLLVYLQLGPLWLLAVIFGWQGIFMTICLVHSLHTHRHVKAMQAAASDHDEPNDSALRERMNSMAAGFQARSYSSRWKLANLPLIDIQLSHPMSEWSGVGPRQPGVARGWIAIGDRAYGILLGIGGIATGLVAFGGLACGGLAAGGLCLGAVTFGGGAIGLLAIGGLAVGGLAIGGVGLGWTALGGCAIGWKAAMGGAAIAWHLAEGGYALAHDLAVGGAGSALEFNTPTARQAVAQSPLKGWMTWLQTSMNVGMVIMVATAILPNLLLIWLTRKPKSRQATPDQ